MNMELKRRTIMDMSPWLLSLLAFALLWSGSLLAQVPIDADGNPIEALDEGIDDSVAGSDEIAALEDEQEPLTAEELENLVGPVALYPDKLLAIVLPASTYPLEIVQAARFLGQLENDSSLKPDESWDDSVTALLNYPEVVEMMNDDIDWTWRLGEAVVSQQADVIAAVESFRDRAYAAGNLKTDERQRVSSDSGTIEIQPIEEDIIYVPYYEPERVVHYQPRQVYYYHPRPYPVYYYPYPAHHSFLSGYFWGVTTAFNIGWSSNHLHVFHHSYWGHPYYGRQYFGHYYRRPSITVYNTYYGNNYRHRSRDHHRDGDYWRPRDGGPRPGHYRSRLERFRDHPRERSVEGYADRNGRSVARTTDGAGFRGNADARRNDRVDTREGFASSRSDNAQENRTRVSPASPSPTLQRRAADSDSPIRFRQRDRAAADVVTQRNRSANVPTARGTEQNVQERDRATQPAESNAAIRFRSRNNADAPGSSPPRTVPRASSDTVDRQASSSSDRVILRQRQAPAPATRGFQSSPDRSSSPSRPDITRAPLASPRSVAPRSSTPRSAPAPRASSPRAPAPKPRASAPASASQPKASAPRAAPPRQSSRQPSASQSGAAPRQSSAPANRSRTRQH